MVVEETVLKLKQVIAEHDGENVADSSFVQVVDALIDLFYDDIGTIKSVSTRSLFDLFIIKVLYVGRRSRDAAVVDYLGQLLDRHLYTRALFPVREGGRTRPLYLSDLLADMLEPERKGGRFQNLFEAYRTYGDNALFMTGIFPATLRRARRRSPMVDASYYVSTGKTCYRLASEHELAEWTRQRDLLAKLSAYFEVYMDALNEVSERYIMGFDMNVIADKMLDNFNLYRQTGDEKYLTNARRYAAILKVDPERFPSLYKRQRGKTVPPKE